MIYLDLPNISNSGTVEQQLAEIRSYIYRNNEQINATLSNLTIDKIWEQTASAISASGGDNEEKSDILSKYQKIRDLIIKTADVIIQTDEQWQMAMNGSYLAKSQFGEYLLNTSVEIDGKSTGFTQLYTYSSELGSDYGNYKSYQQNFIKEGLLDDTGATPIYGIDVGLLTSEFTVTKEDGTTETVTVDSNKRLRITPVKLSLYDGNNEVAYIEENEIYFPKANINGGSINIGNGNFVVDSSGKMTALSGSFRGSINVGDGKFVVTPNGTMKAVGGTFSGTIEAATLKSSFNSVYESVQLNDDRLEVYSIGLQATLDKNGLSLYEGTKYLGYYGKSSISRSDRTNPWGITVELESIGEYFIIRNRADKIVFGYSEGNCFFTDEPEGLYFLTDDLYVRKSSTTYSKAWTGTKSFVSNISDNGDGTISWNTSTFEVVNGLIVS